MICSFNQIDKEKYYFDEEAAELPIYFFEEELMHVSGSKNGEPFNLEDWQKYHIRNIFGWKNKETDDRKHRFWYLEVPKGNGKSAIESGLVIYMCAVDSPPGSEIYCVAGDKFQARIVFDACREMIEENPRLCDKFEVYKNSIVHIRSRSTIHVISADAPGKHGFRPYFIAFDELHVQPNRDLYDVLTKGMMKSRNSMTGMITTAGEIGTFAEEIHDTAISIAKGLVNNDYWYVAIYSGYDEKGKEPKDENIFSKEVIAKANPGYGTIIRPADFDIIVKDTQGQKTSLNAYRQLHLNIWVGSLDSYINVNDFKECNISPVDLERHDKEHTPCFGGLDLASDEDLTAFSLLFPPSGSRKHYDWVCWFWCPEDTVRTREKRENVNYNYWVDKGYVFTTPGDTQDKEAIQKFVKEKCDQFNVVSIAADPSFHKSVLATWVEQDDIPLTQFTQTLSNYHEPTRNLKLLVSKKMINYGGNPVLEWQIDNTMVYRSSNDQVRPMKRVGRGRNKGQVRKKIDGVVSGIMALGESMDLHQEQTPQVFFI